MRYLILLLMVGCAAPTVGDLQLIGNRTDFLSARAPHDAAHCVLRRASGMQLAFGMTTNAALRPRTAPGTFEVVLQTPSGIAGAALVESAGSGSRITVWETGAVGEQLRNVAAACG
jgi:hypothetical protein